MIKAPHRGQQDIDGMQIDLLTSVNCAATAALEASMWGGDLHELLTLPGVCATRSSA